MARKSLHLTILIKDYQKKEDFVKLITVSFDHEIKYLL